MTEPQTVPGSKDDMTLAARLVVEQLVSEPTMRAVLAKQKELIERKNPLTTGEICRRKGWVTASELRWLVNSERPPADLLPGLQIHQFIGRGGMSRVFSGADGATSSAVALKILHPCLRRDPVALADFRREGEMLVSLDHENIVRGYYLHEHDGLHYLVMELVEGRSIQEHLDRAGRFSEDAALYIILQAARALIHLHERGLVHRDIKPGNILIDGRNTVKLCDLGLAVTEGGGECEVTAGTIDYIAPEQAQGQGGLDVRSDIYALGVTLYQLVVGKLPFTGNTDRETLAKRLLDELRSPELKGLNISPHLHYFIQKMMALDREIRYQSPQELIQDIEEQISGNRSLTAQPGKVSYGKMELEKPFGPPKSGRPGGRPGSGEWPGKRRPV